ncbi:hypothetical protein J6590_000695 [Homalodisca vitripennis]|nr:hypothetical protein J6590_000695 [Homalodisca vitripennis]
MSYSLESSLNCERVAQTVHHIAISHQSSNLTVTRRGGEIQRMWDNRAVNLGRTGAAARPLADSVDHCNAIIDITLVFNFDNIKVKDEPLNTPISARYTTTRYISAQVRGMDDICTDTADVTRNIQSF